LVHDEVHQADEFSNWMRRLKDDNAVVRIVARIRRMEQGNPGDTRSVGSGVMEMRIDYGPGYRVYYVQHEASIVILLWRRQADADARCQAGPNYGSRNLREIEMILTTRFDAAEYVNTPKRQAAYITAAFETGDPAFVRDAIGIVARARGMAEVAKLAELNRESLYKALGETGNPEFSTVMRILRALGLALSARPVEKRRTPRKRRAA
jgi:probable addiction module antidote protein/putative addiction module killer protein